MYDVRGGGGDVAGHDGRAKSSPTDPPNVSDDKGPKYGVVSEFACIATLALAGALIGCGLPADEGVVVSCFGLVNQTVPELDGTTSTIPTNLYFGGCDPSDPGMQIVERATATADPSVVAAACDQDCNARLAAYVAAHPEVSLPLSCQTIFTSACDGLGGDISQLPANASAAFQAGGPADARISLTGTVTVTVGGSSAAVPATGIIDVTVGPCAAGATSCPVAVSRFDLTSSEPFVLNNVGVDRAQVQNQGISAGQVGPTQLVIPANTMEAEVSLLIGGSPMAFHVRNDVALTSPGASLDPAQLFSNVSLTMGSGAVAIAMQGIAIGHRPASDLTPRSTTVECACPMCTAPGTFSSLATDVDQDLQSLAWRVDGAVQLADGTNTPPSVDVTFGLGTHDITLVATDSRGAESAASATFAVLDRTAPAVTPPPNITLRSCAFPDIGRATATDVCTSGGDIVISNNAPATFPTGTTTVTWTAEDGSLNDGHATQRVTISQVADTTCCPAGTVIRMVPANHVFTGTSAAECIIGTSGDDTIDGGGGDDYIIGGAGQDTIHGGTGNDTIIGGDGDDLLFGDDGDDRIAGGTGQDHIHGGTGNDTIIGGDGDDTINGDDDNDVIRGGAGQDHLFGDNGDDVVDGEAGDDQISGGAGNDRLIGGTGQDTIDGGAGVDFLAGLDGDDHLNGGTEDDRILGGRGHNVCTTGGGNDTLLFCGP